MRGSKVLKTSVKHTRVTCSHLCQKYEPVSGKGKHVSEEQSPLLFSLRRALHTSTTTLPHSSCWTGFTQTHTINTWQLHGRVGRVTSRRGKERERLGQLYLTVTSMFKDQCDIGFQFCQRRPGHTPETWTGPGTYRFTLPRSQRIHIVLTSDNLITKPR